MLNVGWCTGARFTFLLKMFCQAWQVLKHLRASSPDLKSFSVTIHGPDMSCMIQNKNVYVFLLKYMHVKRSPSHLTEHDIEATPQLFVIEGIHSEADLDADQQDR